jgi:hypothetical protein
MAQDVPIFRQGLPVFDSDTDREFYKIYGKVPSGLEKEQFRRNRPVRASFTEKDYYNIRRAKSPASPWKTHREALDAGRTRLTEPTHDVE